LAIRGQRRQGFDQEEEEACAIEVVGQERCRRKRQQPDGLRSAELALIEQIGQIPDHAAVVLTESLVEDVERGVQNIITSDPHLAVRVRDE
jgi:hypothetical protein